MPEKIELRCIDSPFGQYAFASIGSRICAAEFLDNADSFTVMAKNLSDTAGKKIPVVIKDVSGITLHSIIIKYVRPDNFIFKGTEFQNSVWRTLLQIPFGKCVSYSYVAAMINRPLAVRAVASAVAKNPIAVLIPCHRVIRSSGAVGEYRWGRARKKAILEWEDSNQIKQY